MDVRLLESDILFAFLPPEPLAQRQLRSLWKHLGEREPLHLVIDLSRVEIITSPSIGSLLLLRKLQSERGTRLLLCQVRLATKCILRVVGLESVFDCAGDKTDALRMLDQKPGLPATVPWGDQERREGVPRRWPQRTAGLLESLGSAR